MPRPTPKGGKRSAFCISMNDVEKNLVDSAYPGDIPFSEKMRRLIEDFVVTKKILVMYGDVISKETGEPSVVRDGAVRIFADAPWGKGHFYQGTTYEKIVIDVLGALGVAYPTKEDIVKRVVPALVDAGYVVQVIDDNENDLFDVWMAGEDTGIRICGTCSLASKVKNVIKMLNEALL